jgi:hypothetical protein
MFKSSNPIEEKKRHRARYAKAMLDKPTNRSFVAIYMLDLPRVSIILCSSRYAHTISSSNCRHDPGRDLARHGHHHGLYRPCPHGHHGCDSAAGFAAVP